MPAVEAYAERSKRYNEFFNWMWYVRKANIAGDLSPWGVQKVYDCVFKSEDFHKLAENAWEHIISSYENKKSSIHFIIKNIFDRKLNVIHPQVSKIFSNIFKIRWT